MAGVRGWAHQTYRCGKKVLWELQQDDMRARYRNARGKRNLSSRLQLVLALLLAGFALTAVTRRYRSKPQEAAQKEDTAKPSWTPTWLWGSEPKQEQWPETLVVYIFSNTDPESFNNLKFFLKWGVREGDGAYYIIVVQEGGKSPMVDLEEVVLPGNARLLYHDNECYDWGTLGWIMSAGMVDAEDYKYFIMINSSVRGPYAPPYMPAKGGLRNYMGLKRETPAWHKKLTGRFDNDTRMVGPIISCEGTPYQGDPDREWRVVPHVQSHAIAVDQVGLKVLQDNGNVLKCHTTHWDNKWYAETGASAAVLDSGYNIGSLMRRYEGRDWRSQDSRECEGDRELFSGLDSTFAALQEVLFIPGKEGVLQTSDELLDVASAYERWMEQQSAGDSELLSTVFPDIDEVKQPLVAMMHERGPSCFDLTYYRSLNTDLQQYATDDQLWGHFLHFGQFERRPFRFTCDWDPPAGHDWAGYPIRDSGALDDVKVNDPKKQRRVIRPEAGHGQDDSAPDAPQQEGTTAERRFRQRKVLWIERDLMQIEGRQRQQRALLGAQWHENHVQAQAQLGVIACIWQGVQMYLQSDTQSQHPDVQDKLSRSR